MQAYANVGTAPTRHTAKTSGKAYWEFRASESARGEDKNPTWYTVRIFKDEDPQLKKGDFVVFTGKLKNDIFMGRDGKPMGVLTVLAFNLQKVAKDGKREPVVDAPQAVESTAAATTAPTKETIEKPPLAVQTPVAASSKSPAPPKPLFGGLGPPSVKIVVASSNWSSNLPWGDGFDDDKIHQREERACAQPDERAA